MEKTLTRREAYTLKLSGKLGKRVLRLFRCMEHALKPQQTSIWAIWKKAQVSGWKAQQKKLIPSISREKSCWPEIFLPRKSLQLRFLAVNRSRLICNDLMTLLAGKFLLLLPKKSKHNWIYQKKHPWQLTWFFLTISNSWHPGPTPHQLAWSMLTTDSSRPPGIWLWRMRRIAWFIN